MAISLQIFGIRCNSISPGRVKVKHESKAGDENGDVWSINDGDIEPHPTNRAGMAEDITEAVEYLLGAGFVTGENLTVDGGMNVSDISFEVVYADTITEGEILNIAKLNSPKTRGLAAGPF